MRKFSEVQVQMLNQEEVQSMASEVLLAVASAKTAEEQIAQILEFDKLRRKVMTVICYGILRGQLDCNDKKYMGAFTLYPVMGAINVKLYQIITKSPFKGELENRFGKRIFELAEVQLKSMSQEVLPLMQQEFVIAGEYDRIVANSTFEFEGQTLSFAQLQLYMENTDGEIRKKAWKMWSDFFAENEEKFDDIYDRLVKIRTTQAKALGYNTYTEFSYDKLNRTNYNQADVKNFRDAIVKYIVPVNEKLRKAQAKRIGVDVLKYYDEGAKFKNGNAHPLGGEDFMVKQAQEMFAEMSPKAKEYFDLVVENEFYDLEARQGKKQGGVCVPIIEEGLPFIFTNFNGTIQDFRVLVHEAGHGYEGYLNMEGKLFEYLTTSFEAGETHSMSMEFLSWNWAEKFMGDAADKYRYTHLAEAANFMPYGSMLDEFQHEVYNHPEMTKDERKAVFAEIEKKYFPTKDYDDNDFLKKGTLWYKQQHLFNHAFYYIDYVIAETCALQLWKISREDWNKAFEMYNTFCMIGGEKSFTEVVEASGLESPFKEETIASVAESMKKYIDSVDDSVL